MFRTTRTYQPSSALATTTFLWLILGVLIITNPGCEEPFNPIEQSDSTLYSIYGYLDAGADTQWVRIMPIRETIDQPVLSIDATVTLREVNGSASTVMNDSLFYLTSDDGIVTGFWNFWTTMDVKPGTEYELSVENEDGSRTYAVVTTPPDFVPPDLAGNYVHIFDIDNLVDVRLEWTVYDRIDDVTASFSYSHIDEVIKINDRTNRIQLNPDQDFQPIGWRLGFSDPHAASLRGDYTIVDVTIQITSAGEDWIDFPDLSREVIALPDQTSNILNGVGYLVGSVRKSFPYPVCIAYEAQGEAIPCNG